MTASNPDAFPDYTEEEVTISTELILHDNATVTIVFNKVPLLDVEELFRSLGTEEGLADLEASLFALVSQKVGGLMADLLGNPFLPVPFSVSDFA